MYLTHPLYQKLFFWGPPSYIILDAFFTANNSDKKWPFSEHMLSHKEEKNHTCIICRDIYMYALSQWNTVRKYRVFSMLNRDTWAVQFWTGSQRRFQPVASAPTFVIGFCISKFHMEFCFCFVSFLFRFFSRFARLLGLLGFLSVAFL